MILSPTLKSSKMAKIISMDALRLKFQLGFWIRNHHLLRILWWALLWPLRRRGTKDIIQVLLEKSLAVCHIDYCWWSTLTENCDAQHLTTDHIVSFFENTCLATLKDKKLSKDELQLDAIKLSPNLQLQSLQPSLSVPHWSYQLWTWLHLAWTGLLLIFLLQSQAMIYIYKYD